jgi:hypothetical protein
MQSQRARLQKWELEKKNAAMGLPWNDVQRMILFPGFAATLIIRVAWWREMQSCSGGVREK